MADDRDVSDLRPRPDPTVLTTEAIKRDIAHVRELLTQLIDERTIRFESEIAARDRALDAALTATKDAIAKTESSQQEQVTSLGLELKAEISALEGRQADMRELISASEVRAGVASGKGVGSQQATTMFLSIGALIVMAIGIAVGAVASAMF